MRIEDTELREDILSSILSTAYCDSWYAVRRDDTYLLRRQGVGRSRMFYEACGPALLSTQSCHRFLVEPSIKLTATEMEGTTQYKQLHRPRYEGVVYGSSSNLLLFLHVQ